ncbi:MAG: Bax inhibitor-1/YccA family protein [Bdellovibrionota bacterium]
MRTSNPALSDKHFGRNLSTTGEKMTIAGTVQKSFLLIGLVLASALWSWKNTFPTGWAPDVAPQIPVWYFGVIIFTLIISLVIIFKPTTAPFLAPGYALGEGVLLGTISAVFEAKYPGIALQAILCTMGTFIALLVAYQTRIIKVTENLKLGIVAATGGIALVYLIDMGMRFFGMEVPYIHENGMIGIGVSLFIVVIAAMNLVLDFDFIEKGAENGAPKFMEWYAAFGLLVTLVWLYLEMLRLLSKTRK